VRDATDGRERRETLSTLSVRILSCGSGSPASGSTAPKSSTGMSGSAGGASTVPANESAIDRSHFCRPLVFLHFPASVQATLPRAQASPDFVRQHPPPWGWPWGLRRACSPLSSQRLAPGSASPQSESLIEGVPAKTIPMKRKDIPGLLVTPPEASRHRDTTTRRKCFVTEIRVRRNRRLWRRFDALIPVGDMWSLDICGRSPPWSAAD
jgi:hypothetical protein